MSLSEEFPEAYKELLRNKNVLENHYKTPSDIEFTIENGTLYLLNARRARMSPKARIKSAIDFFLEGRTTLYEAISFIDPEAVHMLLGTEITNRNSLRLVGSGLAASPGSATGKVLIKDTRIYNLVNPKQEIIYVCEDVAPEDIGIMFEAKGVLTTRGGMTSHAAVTMRGMGKPCVAGLEELNIDISNSVLLFGKNKISEENWISIDGTDGSVFEGKGHIVQREWQSIHELQMLYLMVRHSLINHSPPFFLVGLIWYYWDFFIHRRPLISDSTNKTAAKSNKEYLSFAQPSQRSIDKKRRDLTRIPGKYSDEVGRILLGFFDALRRLLAEKLGIGNHHKYFRPLLDPDYTIKEEKNGELYQLIGFEFSNISKYIEHLPDISTVEFHILIFLSSEEDGWFLDHTNPDGESLVASEINIVAYNLYINGASVNLSELPCFYNIVRRREYSRYLQ